MRYCSGFQVEVGDCEVHDCRKLSRIWRDPEWTTEVKIWMANYYGEKYVKQ